MNATSGSTAIGKLMDLQEFLNKVLICVGEHGEPWLAEDVCNHALDIIKEKR